MKPINICAILLVFTVVAFLPQNTATAENTPPGPELNRPVLKHVRAHPEQFPMFNSDEFKDEMKRHREAAKEIMEETKEMRTELREKIVELRQKYFPVPEKDEKREKPDKETREKFIEEVKKLVDAFCVVHEKELKVISGKLFDEKILHMENMINIAKDNKEKIVNAHYKKALTAPFWKRLRGMSHRRIKHHRLHRNSEECPEDAVPFEEK